jgi:hypothetical protein
MNTVAVSRNPTPLLSRPALSIGLSFLLMGLGYAFPLPLVAHAPDRMWAGQMAPEILNLYALTAWMGQAHFFYAFRGQARTLAKQPERSTIFYALVGLTLLELIGLRALIGVGLFSQTSLRTRRPSLSPTINPCWLSPGSVLFSSTLVT